ncbi:hypothetical protein [Streptomyces sp. NPDC002825]|uniref:hypothetical protein n=1 Tax=Streptomyces sp. NPDC002825 TaxID=3154666 RepID=UPI00331B379B
MLTEPTAARKPRARSPLPPRARLLWLGALLFGLLYAHGLHADSSAGHTAPGSVAMAPADHEHDSAHVLDLDVDPVVALGLGHEQPSGDGHDTDGAPTHAVPDCATGQPASDFSIAPPAVSPLDHELGLHDEVRAGRPAVGAPPTAVPCPASVVLRA